VVDKRNQIGRWALEYLSQTRDKSLTRMLDRGNAAHFRPARTKRSSRAAVASLREFRSPRTTFVCLSVREEASSGREPGLLQ